MPIKKFNAVAGISVGDDVIFEVIDDTANVTANNLSVTATTDLGNLSNVKISGGSSGYVIRTDGQGNLSWENPADVGVVGNDTEIQFNDGGTIGGSDKLTFNKTTGQLTVNGTVRANIFSDDGVDIYNFAGLGFNQANAAFTVANNAFTSTNGSIAWATANSAGSYANSAFAKASTALARARTGDSKISGAELSFRSNLLAVCAISPAGEESAINAASASLISVVTFSARCIN